MQIKNSEPLFKQMISYCNVLFLTDYLYDSTSNFNNSGVFKEIYFRNICKLKLSYYRILQ